MHNIIRSHNSAVWILEYALKNLRGLACNVQVKIWTGIHGCGTNQTCTKGTHGIYMRREKRDIKWIIQQHEMCGLDCVSSAYGPVAGCCEYGRRDRG